MRIALGAERADVLGLVLRQGMRTSLAGLAVGLLAVAGVASLVPAQGATRVQPVEVLKAE